MRPELIVVKPIGYVHTSYDDAEVSQSWPRGVSGYIEILPEYIDGISGLEGFSHILILAWMHKVSEEKRRVLRVRYKRLLQAGISPEELPEVGVFASDSPHRPNPIAITTARIIKIEKNMIYVDGIDLYNGTPVLDLRAYMPHHSLREFSIPDWYQHLLEKSGARLEWRDPRRGKLPDDCDV
ncbi:MAG: tRNA (N6-threonylcarbamoyladenosine(37)-N6)-methyltransferase TrmO [Nitrososphaeria archaeon]|nr:tRNA (N6-threonylcarbamoyladenosine(37)-N6)-methyltransferase TrmO [Nitrososphaeria archaeon]